MTYFLIYLIIVSELFFISLYFISHWLRYKRRVSDIFFSIITFLLSLSYLFFSLEFVTTTKLIQIIIDLCIAIFLAYFFIKSMGSEIKIKKRISK